MEIPPIGYLCGDISCERVKQGYDILLRLRSLTPDEFEDHPDSLMAHAWVLLTTEMASRGYDADAMLAIWDHE